MDYDYKIFLRNSKFYSICTIFKRIIENLLYKADYVFIYIILNKLKFLYISINIIYIIIISLN